MPNWKRHIGVLEHIKPPNRLSIHIPLTLKFDYDYQIPAQESEDN